MTALRARKCTAALLAAGVLLVSSGASADVKIWGQAHLSLDNVDVGPETRTALASNTSILGVRGSEDLGDGMNAIWQVAQVVNMDGTGESTFATFNSFAGITGPWGRAIAGIHDTPFKMFNDRLNPFAATLGDNRTFMGTGDRGQPQPGTHYNVRSRNILMYTSPNMNGFQGMIAYSTDYRGQGTDEDIWSASVQYANETYQVGLAYEDHDSIDGSTGLRLGGRVSLGQFQIGGVFEQIDGDPVTSPHLDRNAWSLWGAYKVGPATLRALYGTVDSYSGSSDTGADLWTAGVWYSLSKRTDIYALYAAIDNEDASQRALGRWGHGEHYVPELGGNPEGFSLGLFHKF
jgi:predicted porin